MLVSIHQPEFFPWAGFFNKLAASERFLLFDNVQYQKNYFDNRCRVRLGQAMHWLTVPVRTAGRLEQPICEVEIDNGQNWGSKMWRTIAQAYARAPFLAEWSPFLEQTLAVTKWERLADLNVHIIRHLARYLDLKAELILGSEIGAEGQGSALVLDCCKRLGATAYLSGKHGLEYLDEQAFAAAGVGLIYQDFMPPPYHQGRDPYIGPLSMLDAVLHLGTDARKLVFGEAQ